MLQRRRLLALDRFQICQQCFGLILSGPEHRHVGMPDDDPFSKRFFQSLEGIARLELPKCRRILVRAGPCRFYGMTAGAVRFGDLSTEFDNVVGERRGGEDKNRKCRCKPFHAGNPCREWLTLRVLLAI